MKTRERGFSLIETMMGIGILSGIGLGALFLSNMQKKSLISSKSDVNHAVILIREQISYPRSCELNFLNRQVNSGPYQSLVNSRGETFIQEGQDVDNGNFKVTGIRLVEYHPEVMRTILEVSFKNVSGGATGTVLKRIGIFTRVDGTGKIVECLDPSEMSLEVMVETLCMDADPLNIGDCEQNFAHLLAEVKKLYCNNNPSQPFLRWNSSTGKCVPIDAGKSCPGAFMKGYKSNGEVICSM